VRWDIAKLEAPQQRVIEALSNLWRTRFEAEVAAIEARYARAFADEANKQFLDATVDRESPEP